MPKLNTQLHLQMMRGWKKNSRAIPSAEDKSAAAGPIPKQIYGLSWGDPEKHPALRHVRDHFLRRYISPETTVLEIGPGGGRWTRYLLDAKQIYAVDYHQELLDELRSNFPQPKIIAIKNNGSDFPGVPDGEIDFLFSFGTFVHLDLEIIQAYLENMQRLLKPGSVAVIHYSDMRKPQARSNKGFSDNDPERMCTLVTQCGYRLDEEDTETMWHSSIVRFGLGDSA
jgi:SAM-dependent methyltransferase